MNWIINNWSLLVVVIVFAIGCYIYLKRFLQLPSEQQLKKVKEWLLWAVITTEKELGTGTGTLKLRYCYDLFVQRFPSLVTVISFDLFSQYVDEALIRMKAILNTNKDIECYVKGE